MDQDIGPTTGLRRAARRTLLLFAAAAIAAGAHAERLPLADGRWIETRGSARVERGRVVYVSPEGNLRSLPLAELRSAGAAAAGGERGSPLREYPSDAPIVFTPPLPPVRPLPRRPGVREIPPRCWLANARRGDPPALLCGGGADTPGAKPRPDSREGAEPPAAGATQGAPAPPDS